MMCRSARQALMTKCRLECSSLSHRPEPSTSILVGSCHTPHHRSARKMFLSLFLRRKAQQRRLFQVIPSQRSYGIWLAVALHGDCVITTRLLS